MAFFGHVNELGDVIDDEVYSGHTRINLGSEMGDLEQRLIEENAAEARAYMLHQSSDRNMPTVRFNRRPVINAVPGNQSRSSGEESTTSTSSQRHSSDSLYSWTEAYGLRPESHSNMVPSLDLPSDRTDPSYLRDVADIKVEREPEAAYENWYSAKQKMRQQQQQRVQAERERQQQRAEERKRLAEICYERWRREKKRLANEQRMDHHIARAAYNVSCGTLPTTKAVRNVAPEEVKQVVDNWWLKKMREQERQREAKRRAERRYAEEQQRRKQLAEHAWKQWISKVGGKPKPVPLNQGMDSLRGTISELYVNPKSWTPPTTETTK